MLKPRALAPSQNEAPRIGEVVIIMDLRRNTPAAGLRRLNGILEWRGAPEGMPAKNRVERLHEIARDLHDAYCEGHREQIESINAGHDLVTTSLPKLLHSNSPEDLIEEEAKIFGALIDVASRQIKAWSQFKAKIEGYRSAGAG